jgi:hypothetical protein
VLEVRDQIECILVRHLPDLMIIPVGHPNVYTGHS